MRLRQPDTDDGARSEALALLPDVEPRTEAYGRLVAILGTLEPPGCVDLFRWRLPHDPDGARAMVAGWLE